MICRRRVSDVNLNSYWSYDLSKILISCGEPSGDLYGGALTRELVKLEPGLRISGLGGDRLRESGCDLVAHYEGLAATGLSEALAVLPRSYATYRRMIAHARTKCPDVFVAIDFPEVNFRLSAVLRKLGIPTVYYIGPQAWAWRRRRFEKMRQLVDLALVIFPFEVALYKEAGIPVKFVGHPLLELSKPFEPRDVFLRKLELQSGHPTIALLPGRRANEVRALLPDIVAGSVLVRERIKTAQFIVARAPHLEDTLFEPLGQLRRAGIPVAVTTERTDDVLAAADVAVTASGTATVQAAIHGCPMVIVYRLSALTYRLVKRFAHVDNVGMVNLIAGKQVVPELLQDALTPETVSAEVLRYLTDSTLALDSKEKLAEVRHKLGTEGASRRTAEHVLAIARQGTM